MAKKIGIIGGGIAGTALGYNLSLYGDEAEIHIFEKDESAAEPQQNLQAQFVCSTIH